MSIIFDHQWHSLPFYWHTDKCVKHLRYCYFCLNIVCLVFTFEHVYHLNDTRSVFSSSAWGMKWWMKAGSPQQVIHLPLGFVMYFTCFCIGTRHKPPRKERISVCDGTRLGYSQQPTSARRHNTYVSNNYWFALSYVLVFLCIFCLV